MEGLKEIYSDSKQYLTTLLEFLDPIATKLSVNYHQNKYISRACSHITLMDPRRARSAISLPPRRRKQLEEVRQQLRDRLRAMDKPLDAIFFKNSSQLEKLVYPFTLVNIFFIGLIMGEFREWFHVFYTIMLAILMPIRFYTYYKTANHYFMADLCYFVNAMCMAYIWGFPNSKSLFHSCFALTFGTLCFAVITWRNSLVLHSIDKITSCFIHIIPPCSMYVIYHGLPESYKELRFTGARSDPSSVGLRWNIMWTSWYYLVWQCLYHYFITMRKSSKIKSGKRMTSFEYLTTHQYKNFWAVKLPSPLPMIMYTLLQYLYQLFTMLLCGVWLKYKIAAAVFLILIFACAARNGATYYVDYYGKHYDKEVNALREEVEVLQQKLFEIKNIDGLDSSDSDKDDFMSAFNTINDDSSDVWISNSSGDDKID